MQGLTRHYALLNWVLDVVVLGGECVPDSWIGVIPANPLGAYFLTLNVSQNDAVGVQVVGDHEAQCCEV